MTSCTTGPNGTKCLVCTAWDSATERELSLRRIYANDMRQIADDIGDHYDSERTRDAEHVVAITDRLYSKARELRRP